MLFPFSRLLVRCSILVLCLTSALLTRSLGAGPAPTSFFDLGQFVGGINGISDNAQTLFGYTYVDLEGGEIERTHVWRRGSDGWVRSFMDDDELLNTWASAISPDGTIIVGNVRTGTGGILPTSAAIWKLTDGHWVRTDLPSPLPYDASVTALSADGKVLLGYQRQESGRYMPYVWRELNGTWTGDYLPAPEGVSAVSATALTADGKHLCGSVRSGDLGTSIGTSEVLVWSLTENGWSYTSLPCDQTHPFNGAQAIASNGRTVLGHTVIDGVSQVAAWNLTSQGWVQTVLPVIAGYSDATDLSADGTVAIGTSASSNEGGSVRISWEYKNGKWGMAKTGSHSEAEANAGSLTSDGRLCIAQTSAVTPRYWNLKTGRWISIADVMETVVPQSVLQGWDFEVDAIPYGLKYDPATKSYSTFGYASHGDTTSYWVVTNFSTASLVEHVYVNQTIERELLDYGEGAYRLSNLPPGITYKSETRTISGSIAKPGSYRIKYTSKTNVEREVVVVVKSLPAAMIQPQVITLRKGASLYGTINIFINEAGAVRGSVNLPSRKAAGFSGILKIDSSGSIASAYAGRSNKKPGLEFMINSGRTNVGAKLKINLTTDGIIDVQLDVPAWKVSASGNSD